MRRRTGKMGARAPVHVGFRPRLLRAAPGDVVVIDVVAVPARELDSAKLVLRWDTGVLDYLGMSSGTHFRRGAFEETSHGCLLSSIEDGGAAGSGWLATATFRAIAPGQAHVRLRPKGYLIGAESVEHASWGAAEINVQERRANRPSMVLVPERPGGVAVIDRTFPVHVELRGVHNIGRAWFTVTWNPELLQYRNAVPGPFLESEGGTAGFVEMPVGDGRTTFAVDRLPAASGVPPKGVSGSGRVATLHFKGIGSSHRSKEKPRRPELGKTALHLLASETGLWDMQADQSRPSHLKFHREGLLVRVQKYAPRTEREAPPARAAKKGAPSVPKVVDAQGLTDRDLDLLEIAYQHGFITVAQMARFFPSKKRSSGRHSPAVYRRDRELVRGGFLEHHRPRAVGDIEDAGVKLTGGVRLITAKGVRALFERHRAEDELDRVSTLTPQTFMHNRLLLDLRLDLRDAGCPYGWVPERVVRKRWQAGDTMLRFAPDAILTRGKGQLPIALELERQPKDWRKYRDYLVRYRNLIPIKGLAWVLLVVPAEDDRTWLLESAWPTALREIRRDADLMNQLGTAPPVDYFKLVLLDDLRLDWQTAHAVWIAPSGKKGEGEVGSLTDAASWDGIEIGRPSTYLAALQERRVIVAKRRQEYAEFVRLRDHEPEWAKLDRMLHAGKLMAVADGTEVRLLGQELFTVDGRFKLPLVRVRMRQGEHAHREGWVLRARIHEYGDQRGEYGDQRGAGYLSSA